MGQALILVVDGDPDIRNLVQDVLGEQYRVALAGSAADGLASLSATPPDAAVIECVLPGGGMEKLLRRAETACVPVLLTSGHPGMIDAYAGGDVAFLAKPYRIRDLLDIVARLLATRRRDPGSAAGE